MVLRSGHGNGRGRVHVEVLPADEQPAGIPAPAGVEVPALPGSDRTAAGHMRAGTPGAVALAKRGAEARWARARELKALRGLGLQGFTPDVLKPYLNDALEFAKHECARLANEVGGGICAANVSALVQQAALAMAASRALYAAGQLKEAANLGVEVRQNLLAARELCAKDAKHRRENAPQQSVRELLGLNK